MPVLQSEPLDEDTVFSLAKKLIFLDYCGPSGALGSFQNLSDAIVKLVWNTGARRKYDSDAILFTEAERRTLMQPKECHGFPLPAFCSLMKEGFGEEYFISAYGSSGHKQFDLFLANLVHYFVCSLNLGEYHKETIAWFQERQKWPEAKRGAGLSRIMLAVWASDPQLQQRYNLETEKGLLGWIGCFTLWTLRNIPGYRTPAWLQDALDSPAGIPHANDAGLSTLMHAIYLSSPDFYNAYNIMKHSDACRFSQFFLSSLTSNIPLYTSPAWVRDVANQRM